jgi:hypothetical protein
MAPSWVEGRSTLKRTHLDKLGGRTPPVVVWEMEGGGWKLETEGGRQAA